jgi:glucose-6-phosphate dehydrogenase assembly protein OpcA
MEGTLIRRETRASAPDSIDDDLRALWKEVAEQTPVARAVMANLIVFVAGGGEPGDVPLDDVVQRHPSRVIVLRHWPCDAERRPSEAAISIVSFGPAHARYAVEEIILNAPCGDRSLPSVVRRFARGDLPTSIWWTEDFSRVAPIAPVVRMGRQLVFDSCGWRDIGRAVTALAPLLREPDAPRLGDINWRRLSPVRQALIHGARSLPHDMPRPRVQIRHRPGDAALAWLLAGWIAARLGWPDGAWPADIEEVRRGEDVVSVEVGPLTVTMNGRSVVARSAASPPFRMPAHREPVAVAVAAELASLVEDRSLADALAALARQPALG